MWEINHVDPSVSVSNLYKTEKTNSLLVPLNILHYKALP